tara:strand:- start:254 stop:547 length:294 start_codon:yes stop_codon:yes gene_type:complete
LKFGQAVAEDQDTLVVIIVLSRSVEQVETMLLKLLIPIQVANIRYVREALGLVVKHIHVVLEWDVVHTLMDTIYQTFVLQEPAEAGCVTEMLGVKDI